MCYHNARCKKFARVAVAYLTCERKSQNRIKRLNKEKKGGDGLFCLNFQLQYCRNSFVAFSMWLTNCSVLQYTQYARDFPREEHNNYIIILFYLIKMKKVRDKKEISYSATRRRIFPQTCVTVRATAICTCPRSRLLWRLNELYGRLGGADFRGVKKANRVHAPLVPK